MEHKVNDFRGVFITPFDYKVFDNSIKFDSTVSLEQNNDINQQLKT